MLMTYDFNPCKSNSIEMHNTTLVGYVVLEIYVDDILLTGSDAANIFAAKAYL